MLDESTPDRFAVAGVFGGVEDVLMPEVIEFLGPRDDRLAGVGRDQVEELAILLFQLVGAVAQPPPPSLLAEQAVLYRLQVEGHDALPFCVHDESPGSRSFLVRELPTAPSTEICSSGMDRGAIIKSGK